MADHPEHEHKGEHLHVGHDHDAEHEHISEDEVITLVDEDGKEHQFALLDVIEVDENEYAILVPAEDGDAEEADEAVILRMEEDDEGNEVLVDIDDEAEFERVATAWEELLDEEDGLDDDDEGEDK